MLRVVGVGGMPASGKTTLFRAFMEGGFWVQVKQKLVVYSEDALRRTVVLGDYSDGTFGGTDKLSMAVQPQAVELLRDWASDPLREGYSVLFEGDRLFNASFIREVAALPGVSCRWVLLGAGREVLSR